jgi:hypothetical protein
LTKSAPWLLLLSSLAAVLCRARADARPMQQVICQQQPSCAKQVEAAIKQSATDRAAALAIMLEAFRKYTDPRLCYNLGRLYQQLDRPADAAAQYRCFLDSGVESRPEILAKARTYLEQMVAESATVDRLSPPAKVDSQPQAESQPKGDRLPMAESPPKAESPPNGENVPTARSLPNAESPANTAAPVPTASTQISTAPISVNPVPKKPAHRQWWFWTLVGGVSAAAAVGIAIGVAAQEPDLSGARQYRLFPSMN